MNPIPEPERLLIIKNILAACKNINKLNKRGYDFLYLSSGFIAHYNINGFKDCYSSEKSLKQDILSFQKFNQWNNFHIGEKNYEYMMSKKDVFNRICNAL